MSIQGEDHHNSAREIILERGRESRSYWIDIWVYRELFIVLAWRDISVQYKQSIFGILWAIVRPLLTMTIFTFVFGRIAGLPAEGEGPYALMVYSGAIAWFLFASTLSSGANCLVSNANLIGKVYFPRILIPISSSIVAFIDFIISLIPLVIIMFFMWHPPTWRIFTIPIFVIFGVTAALGPALILSALNVRYRDFRFIMPFIIQFGLYISPVGFSSSLIEGQLRLIYSLNPMVSVIEGMRWAVIGESSPIWWPGLFAGLSVTCLSLWLGFIVFRRTEKTFADMV